MSFNSEYFLNKALGEDFLESLSKSEIWKPGTKSVTDTEDMRVGLKIVPRTVLSFLIRELVPLSIGENRRIVLQMAYNSFLNVTKHERDQYSGDIEQNGKKLTEFKFRSLPGLGLVLMSTFELYSIDDLVSPKVPEVSEDIDLKVQKMIDERLALHDLINQVVDKKMMHKEAVNNLLLMKLTEELKKERQEVDNARATAELAHDRIAALEKKTIISELKQEPMKKPLKPLQKFLEERKKPQEFSIQMAKGEVFTCPDCCRDIFDGNAFSGCICLGADMEKKVFIKKSEDGIKIRFSRGWDPENIEMLLEVLQKKNG